MDPRDDRPTEPPSGEPALAADEAPDDEAMEHGRIGYGHYGRWTPLGLALLLVVTLLAIGIANQRQGGEADTATLAGSTPSAGVRAGTVAPDFSLTLFSGDSLRLSELRGKVVVLNFWASWCDPCKEEMPAIQTVAASAGPDVTVVGIGLKNDKDADARAFARKYGVTYPIGRDSGAGGDAVVGPIERDYGVFGAPTTIVVHPDGTIAAVALGPQTADQFRDLIAQAKQPAQG